MEYITTFNTATLALAVGYIVWLAAAFLASKLLKNKSKEVQLRAGGAFGVFTLVLWIIGFIAVGIHNFASLTTFFSVVVVGIAAYGTYVWFAHGRSIEAIVETKIDSMAADMVEYGHG